MSLRARLLRLAAGRDVIGAGVDVSPGELLHFLWVRGGRARLRGLAYAWRLGRCDGGLLVGVRTQILFPRRLHVGRQVAIGADSYVNALATQGMHLGDRVRIREGAWIQATSQLDDPGVGLTIGADTYIGPRCLIGAGGGITIGTRVSFGAGVHLLAENHTFRDGGRLIQEQGVTRAGITIGDDVWIGNQAVILDGVTVGNGAVVGAASVVHHDVPPRAIAVGNPARVVGYRS